MSKVGRRRKTARLILRARPTRPTAVRVSKRRRSEGKIARVAPQQIIQTAHHEAAHAVVSYRAAGFAGGDVTIVPNADTGTLGTCADFLTDSFSDDDMLA